VYVTPEFDLPIAPEGEQNAPGVTVFTLTEGSELCVGVGVTSGTEAISVVPSSPQVETTEFNFSASCESAVKEYLIFIDIQFWI
jgi:hypothetical protein